MIEIRRDEPGGFQAKAAFFVANRLFSILPLLLLKWSTLVLEFRGLSNRRELCCEGCLKARQRTY